MLFTIQICTNLRAQCFYLCHAAAWCIGLLIRMGTPIFGWCAGIAWQDMNVQVRHMMA